MTAEELDDIRKMTEKELGNIRELVEATTPGTWTMDSAGIIWASAESGKMIAKVTGETLQRDMANGVLICLARPFIIVLLKEIELLQMALTGLGRQPAPDCAENHTVGMSAVEERG